MHLNVTINGKPQKFDGNPSAEYEISYEELCEEANKNPLHNPTVVCCIPSLKRGYIDTTITAGEKAPLVDGAIYQVMVTGGA
jgi:hypothetical protein